MSDMKSTVRNHVLYNDSLGNMVEYYNSMTGDGGLMLKTLIKSSHNL